MERPSAYIPMDRRQALVQNKHLPSRVQGAALFADISGFTPLTEGLVRELGARRGAEELTHYLNLIYDALIAELHRFGGSVINFSGDAITCWFNDDNGLRAVACGLAMQQTMMLFANLRTPAGTPVAIAVKAAVTAGDASRYVVGDPKVQIIDVLAGLTLHRLAEAEHQAEKGDVVLDEATAVSLAEKIQIATWRKDEETKHQYAVVKKLTAPVKGASWPAFPPESLDDETIRPWLLPPVYERLQSGGGEFLAELRPALALFLRFDGIDYDNDPAGEEKLNSFTRAVQSILTRYDSNLLQLSVGDKGSLLYAAFGAPVAHEDDAVRAMSAALELRQLPQTLDFLTCIQIGISQGRLRTGAYGGSMRRTYGVLGDDVNLAARLMQTAVSGQILISEKAQQMALEHFVWESLPSVYVKGKSEPITIFNLMSHKKQQAIRLQEPQYALPMVGRKTELALIEEKIEQTVGGKGQIVGIFAEAGMGKSRLVAEAIRIASEKNLLGYGGECQSYGANTSYLVWQRIWQAFFSLNPEWSLSEQILALEAQLALINPDLLPRLPLLGAVLNLPIPDNDLTHSFDAKLRKTSLEGLLVECLRVRSQDEALLLVLEDCHWLDPLSYDLLEVIARAMADRPVAIVIAAREPQLLHLPSVQVNTLPNYTCIELAEFSSDESKHLIELKLGQYFAGETAVSPLFIEQIASRAGGNPFYIEELLNYLQDRNISPHATYSLESIDLPASLHSLILSRIDQLSESQKSTIKVASVIGRLFRAAMLWGAYPQLGNDSRVKTDLDVLSDLDLTPLDSPEPELTYLFKSIVTQEVAYESMPYSTRAMLHDLVGQFIERTYADSIDQFIDLLAHHYEHSENEAKKREYLLKAGEAAQADYNNTAAITYYEKVLPLLEEVARVSALLRLGNVLALIGHWDNAHETYEKAMSLARHLGSQQEEAWAQTAVAELRRKQGQYEKASDWLDAARKIFDAVGNKAGVGQVLKQGGTVAAQQGNFEEATTLYEESLLIQRELDNQPEVANLLNNLGIIARLQGDRTVASYLYSESLAILRQLGDRRAIAACLNNLGNLALDSRDFAEARRHLEEAVKLQKEVGDRAFIANALNNLGNVARAQQDYLVAQSLYNDSLIINQELGDRWALAYLLEDIGSLAAKQKQAERALRLIGAAATLRTLIGAPHSVSEHEKLADTLKPLSQLLDQSAYDALYQEGKLLPLEDAVEFALSNKLPTLA